MSTRALAVALLLFSPLLPRLAAKRPPAPVVPPVSAHGVEYRAVHERDVKRGIKGLVEARDKKTGKALWRVKVYEVTYRPGLETDVQDVHIASLAFDGKGGLVVRTEGKKAYRLDLTKRTVVPVPPGK
jgi:hypothetical protein